MVIPAGLRSFALQPQRAARSVQATGPVDRVELRRKKSGPGFWKTTALVVCLSLVAGLGAAQAQQLEPRPVSLSQQLEDGKRCESDIRRHHARGDDPAQQARVEALNGKLSGHAQRGAIDYHVNLTKGWGSWAASCGNGSLFVDQDLASRLTEDELLFVGGHELGHTELGHQADRRALMDAVGWRWLLPWTDLTGQLQAQGRRQELEADCFARRLVPPGVAESALKKVLQGVEQQGGDHPSLQVRLDNLSRCAAGPTRMGSMNLGGGNDQARLGFATIRDLVGRQVVEHNLEAVTFQEVDVHTGRTGGKDYNEEILAGVFQADLGGRGLRKTEEGYVTTLADGTTRRLTVERHDQGDLRAYSATWTGLSGRSQTWTMHFGNSLGVSGGSFGNAILLGPGQQATAVKLHDLGPNDPDNENRTALEVQLGHASIFSTHLTSGDSDLEQSTRARQYATLTSLVQGREQVRVGGDFNSAPGQVWFDGLEPRHYPSLGLRQTGPGAPHIDHVLTSQGRVAERSTAEGVEPVHDFTAVRLT